MNGNREEFNSTASDSTNENHICDPGPQNLAW